MYYLRCSEHKRLYEQLIQEESLYENTVIDSIY